MTKKFQLEICTMIEIKSPVWLAQTAINKTLCTSVPKTTQNLSTSFFQRFKIGPTKRGAFTTYWLIQLNNGEKKAAVTTSVTAAFFLPSSIGNDKGGVIALRKLTLGRSLTSFGDNGNGFQSLQKQLQHSPTGFHSLSIIMR